MDRPNDIASEGEVKRKFTEFWEWFESISGVPYEITGKYLFYSPDREYLCNMALIEIKSHAFHKAKVSRQLEGSNTDWVLVLYYKDDSRKQELADRARSEYPGARYRWWKTNAATLEGQYSEEFLSKLSPDRAKEFQREGKEALGFHWPKHEWDIFEFTRQDDPRRQHQNHPNPRFGHHYHPGGSI